MNKFLRPARNVRQLAPWVALTVGCLCAAIGEVFPRPIVGAPKAWQASSARPLAAVPHRLSAVVNRSEWRNSVRPKVGATQLTSSTNFQTYCSFLQVLCRSKVVFQLGEVAEIFVEIGPRLLLGRSRVQSQTPGRWLSTLDSRPSTLDYE